MLLSEFKLKTAVCKSIRQYLSIAPRKTEISAGIPQLFNHNHVSFISSEAKPKSVPLIPEQDIEKFQKLSLPFEYVHKIPKKHAVDLLFNGFNQWIGLPADKVKIFEEIYLDLYDDGVLIDDWIDESPSRRVAPTAHRIYGSKKTLLAFSAYMLCIADKLKQFNNPDIIRLYYTKKLQYIMGQHLELSWATVSKCPTMSEYRDLIRLKFGSYPSFIVEAMQSLSECKQDFSTLLRCYTEYLQYLTDYGSFGHGPYGKSKGLGEDISTGKFSVPIIHAVSSGTREGEIIYNIVQQCTRDDDLIKYCISLIEKLGSFEYTKQLTSDSEQEFRAEIDRLGGNVMLEEMIDKINAWTGDEKYTDN